MHKEVDVTIRLTYLKYWLNFAEIHRVSQHSNQTAYLYLSIQALAAGHKKRTNLSK